MSVMDQALTHQPAVVPPAGANAVDVQYVQQAYAALHVALAASRAASTEGSCHAVRALAREATAQQTTELVAVTACMREWGMPAPLGPYPDATTLRELEGTAFDRAFTDQLAAHAQASKAAARAQVDGGESKRVRDIARRSVQTQGLVLAAVARHARSQASS